MAFLASSRYENHPSWRTVYADGLNSKEKGHFFFRKGRYGVLCVNNPAYRAYVMDNLRELCTRYSFEGMFLDMPLLAGGVLLRFL